MYLISRGSQLFSGNRTYLAQSFEALLLGVSVDVGSNEETDDVEERHPGVLGEELLGEGQSQRRSDPADLHDGHETSADGRANLVEGARASNNGHRAQVDGVLDGGDLSTMGTSLVIYELADLVAVDRWDGGESYN